MAASTPITAEQFLAQPRHEDERVELVRGEVVTMGTAQFIHERVKARLIRALSNYLIKRPIGELLNEQILKPAPAAAPAIAPALILEVVSSESAAYLEDKVSLYLSSGCKEVWIAYSGLRTIRTFYPGGSSRYFGESDTLVCDWLPGQDRCRFSLRRNLRTRVSLKSMAAATTVTAEQFLAQPRHEDERVELVRGEVVEMGNAQFIHERVKANLSGWLVPFVRQAQLGHVFFETMFRFGDEDLRIPDLSLLLNEQIPNPAPAAIPAIAPALAVEVVSSESAADLEDKVDLYLDRGCKEVWIVYPEQRVIRTFHPDGVSRRYRQADALTCDWLPGLTIPVASVFEGI